MIVGTKDINLSELAECIQKGGALDSYSLSLVPKYLQHIPEIVMNQKYLVALNIRRIESIPYTIRSLRCEELLKGVYITGITDRLIDMDDIMCSVNADNLIRFIKENEDD